MNKSHTIINISDLGKKYILKNKQSLEIIKNLNLKINTHSKVCILGPSGSGKTTFLNILGLLDRDFIGNYSFKNKDIFSYSENQISKIRGTDFGIIHQFFHLIPELTSIENVMLPILINTNNKNAYELSKKIMIEFGLEDRFNFKPLNLSGGEQQRVAIARSLVNNPDIILADEMTGNLDDNTANKIFSFFIKYLEQNKKTIVYVTHNTKYSNYADTIYNFQNMKLTKIND
tara:strand:- start:3479 stop:4171 length:693 start_codon:yes stop_codon:yes gene_type:complete